MGKRIGAIIALISFLILSGHPVAAEDGGPVSDYRSVFKPFKSSDKVLIAIRSFKQGGSEKVLAVDPAAFDTQVMDATVAEASGEVQRAEWLPTPYIRALIKYTSGAAGYSNHGITRGESPAGVFMTVDLCPGKKPLDRDFFEGTIAIRGEGMGPVPIAVAISGLWMERHSGELGWLRDRVREGALDITWVNHSLTHPYDPSREDSVNFLLTPGVDFNNEVLGLEKALIEAGLLPSPFFRFPGLVSDEALLKRLMGLSLIPVGAEAWLAKGEEVKGGSIVLVHGNGNEPAGVKKALAFYEEKKEDLKDKLKLLPLRDAFLAKGHMDSNNGGETTGSAGSGPKRP